MVGDTEGHSFRDVFSRLWPDAIALALDGLRDAADRDADVLRGAQFDLTVCRIWSKIADLLGPPEIVRPRAPEPLAVTELLGDTEPLDGTELSDGPEPPGGTELSGGAEPQTTGTPSPHASVAETEPVTPAGYSASAEFFDLVAEGHTATGSVPAVVAALAGIDPSSGPILDLGAGTGLVTEAVARAYPQAEIVAAEPSAGMRAALTSRVFSDEDLRRRVTVTDGAAPDLDLPASLSAVVLCGVLGHLDAQARATLWGRLDERLAPDAPIIVELMNLERPATLPELRLARAVVGRQTYTWWFSGEPEACPAPTAGTDTGPAPGAVGGDADRMRLRSRWTVHDGDALVREVPDAYVWHAFDLDRVARESGRVLERLASRPGGPPLAVLRKHQATPPA